ncbi:uncharacterized protein LOC117505118 [Thalassophryne amazonica]|uniref:uncharacterized protein LOC117505118 n=1 Tax=Thalassophryne amazonica TaxID=390379 RepID=UPI001470A1A5|nr:uncharacterized protein LOC117505118 [Thalassophryne amazonica]
MSFTPTAALILYSFSWILVSVCESHMVEVQPGETVTLFCQNFTGHRSSITWFRLVGRSNINRISSKFSSDVPASFFKEFRDEKYEMTSNTSTIFLQLKRVDQSSSGLYFCGFYSSNNPVIVSATYLRVQVINGITTSMKAILGSVNILLMMVIFGLLVKIRKVQRDLDEQNLQWRENKGCDDLNYAALSFPLKAKRRPGWQEDVDPNAGYAATR